MMCCGGVVHPSYSTCFLQPALDLFCMAFLSNVLTVTLAVLILRRSYIASGLYYL